MYATQKVSLPERLLRRYVYWRSIHTNGRTDTYLDRYVLWGSRGQPDDRRSVRLHHIRLSDSIKDLHDHPWGFVSIILRGTYLERRSGGRVRRFHPGMINHHRAGDAHALYLDKPVWTLIFCGRRVRDWGFWTDNETRFVPWREYVDDLEQYPPESRVAL